MLYQMNQRKKGLLLIAIFTCIGFFVFFFVGILSNHHENKIPTDPKILNPESILLQEIKKVKQEKGAAYAWTYFKKHYEPTAPNAHGIAHYIGASLYDEKGFSGITYCDSHIAHGCYHGFIQEFILSEGIDKINKVSEICKKNSLSTLNCYHGIGHGLVSYYNYDIPSSLTACDTYSDPAYAYGCYSGVFMENGLNNTAQAKRSDPLFPCSSLSKKHKPSCYQNQIYFLRKLFGNDFKAMFQACEGEADPTFARRCVQGIGGYITLYYNYNPEKIRKACSLDLINKAECIISAAEVSLIYKIPLSQVQNDFCSFLSNAQYERCTNRTTTLETETFQE